jgi:hypothetical protein
MKGKLESGKLLIAADQQLITYFDLEKRNNQENSGKLQQSQNSIILSPLLKLEQAA